MILPDADRIAVRQVDLRDPSSDNLQLQGYAWLWVLARLHSTPIGHVVVPVRDGRVSGDELREAIQHRLAPDIVRLLIERWIAVGCPEVPHFFEIAASNVGRVQDNWPKVTVAICTRDRPTELERCICSLLELDYPEVELLVIDNAPVAPCADVVARYPSVRYVSEPKPGLDWARNRAIAEARGELIAFTDDDVVVDPGWLRALAAVFVEHPTVVAVTGLVLPAELETPSQILFEQNGGFSRGSRRFWFGVNVPGGEHAATFNADVGKCGTGANMAYRRSVFERVGLFDPALDVGTVTNGGGDLEMFFRVMKGGFLLVYEPKALVWHHHRREYAALRRQIANNGVGYYSFLTRTGVHFPEERAAVLRLGAWWLAHSSTRRMLFGAIRGRRAVRELATGEFVGSWLGLGAYPKARRAAQALAGKLLGPDSMNLDRIVAPRITSTKDALAIAVRRVDAETVVGIHDVTEYSKTRVFVAYRDKVLGHVDIANLYSPISASWLRDAIADELWLQLAQSLTGETGTAATIAVVDKFNQEMPDAAGSSRTRFEPGAANVSVVIATLDRPDDLRRCLESFGAMTSQRNVELVVVDNHPDSFVTPKVVAEFPHVKLVSEPRRGLSYARNRGILNSNGQFVASTDDDVIVDANWLTRLVAPFARGDVYAVTGNTLPIELETVAQQLFERYSGLGRGYERREVGSHWFKEQQGAVPTWTLGATANAAFRSNAFRDPRIGLLEEALGPGTPTGVGEDTYLFYKILKAGYTIVYEPGAIVWHRHRRTMSALRHQLFNYSKGHVAYHLHTLIHDNDTRALSHLFKTMPRWRVKQMLRIALDEFRGKDAYPISLVLLELWGHLLGPLGLLRAEARARRLRADAA